eukprot:548348_1
MSEWVAVQDPSSGKTYYANTKTRETSWDVPPGFQPPSNTGAASKWKKAHDPNSNKDYWFHVDTKETTWTMPKELAGTGGGADAAMKATKEDIKRGSVINFDAAWGSDTDDDKNDDDDTAMKATKEDIKRGSVINFDAAWGSDTDDDKNDDDDTAMKATKEDIKRGSVINFDAAWGSDTDDDENDDDAKKSKPPPIKVLDPQKELAGVVIDYEGEFKFETDQKQQNTSAVSDRVFSKQKQEIIDRYVASKIARINKNESLVDIVSDYALPTLNDPILNDYKRQIIAFLQENNITIDGYLSHIKRNDFVTDVAWHCGSNENATASLHKPLYRLYGTIAQYADYEALKRKMEHQNGSCCVCQCNYRSLQSITVTNRMITTDKIVLTTTKVVENGGDKYETMTSLKPRASIFLKYT